MKPSQIRTELLEEHGRLRSLVDGVRRTDAAASGDPARREELRAAVVQLADELRRHNLREEELLRGIIPSVDAWGKVRKEILDEEHVSEHRELYGALLGVQRGSLAAVLDRVLAHMEREERTVFAEDVLRDDVVVVDHFGG